MAKRQERLKNLMKDRNATEQGLTLYQIFCEVYPDVVEEYRNGKRDEYGVETVEYVFRNKYNLYTRRMIKHLRRTDDGFRWLSPVPCKDERGKIKEYRYVNIKARNPDGSDNQFLTGVNAFWLKRAESRIKGIERIRNRLKMISQMTEEEFNKKRTLFLASLEYENGILDCCSDKNIDEMIGQLKVEGNLPKLSVGRKPNYKKITNVIKKELLNKHVMLRDGWLTNEGKPPGYEMIWQSVKDTIATYCNSKSYQTKKLTPKEATRHIT